MKVLLTMCKAVQMDETTPPLSLLVLAATARQDGHSVRIVCPIELDSFLANEAGDLADYDVIGFSVNSFNWFATKQALGDVHRRNPALRIVLGGPHPTHFDRHCLLTTAAQIVVRGEAEVSFTELLRALERREPLDRIRGITFKDERGVIVATEDRPLLTEAELDAMPLPAYDLIPPGRYGFVPLETSRGCFYHCVFCAIPFPRSYRTYSLARTEKALYVLRDLKDRFTRHAIFLSDDSFSAIKEHAQGVLQLVSSVDRSFLIGCEARINEIRRNELLPSFSKTNLFLLQVGVECGYAEGLRRIKKGLKIQDIIEFSKAAAHTPFHSQIYWSFIIGFPWEMEQEVTQTISFAFDIAAQTGSQQPQVNSFSPYPGSTIIAAPEQFGLDPVTAELYDTNQWFSNFIGYTRIPQPNRELIYQYLHKRHYSYPYSVTSPFLSLPDGTLLDSRASPAIPRVQS